MAIKRDKVLRDAEKLVQKGKLEQAVKEYEKIRRRFKDDTTVINRLGDIYGRLGQVERAIELYEEVAEHFTADGFTTKAIAILKKIQRLDPQRLDVFERLAELYFDQGLMAEAKREYQILADWYVKNGELEKAIESHERLVDLDPSNHVSALRLADLLLRRGEITSALKVYDRLGKMLLEAGKLDEAERLYRHVLEQNPPQGEFMADVCRTFLDAGRTPLVLEFLNWAVEASPEDVDLKTVLVRTHLTMGEATAAMEIANQVLEIEPDNSEMRSIVGGALMSAGNVAEARDMLLPAVEAMIAKGQHKEAQSVLQDLLQELSEDQDLLRLAVRAYSPSGDSETLFTLKAALAESYFQSKDLEAAKRLFIEVLEADPENQQFRQRLAELDDVNEGYFKPPGAEDTFQEGDVEVIEIEDAAVEGDAGAPAAPVTEPSAAESSQPTPAPPTSVPSSGEDIPAPGSFDLEERLAEASVFAKYGLTEKAISHLEDVVLFCPDELEPRQRLALLYVENGQRDQAIAMAEPVVRHHLGNDTMDQINGLVEALPELTDPSAAPLPAAGPTGVGSVPTETETAAAAAPDEITLGAESPPAEFVDEESDLIEVVDIEGELTAPPSPEPPDPEVEEFAVDFGTGVGVTDDSQEVAATDVEDAELIDVPPAGDDAAAEEVALEPEPAPAAELELPPPAPELVAEPEPVVEEEVADELVEISESFVGPSMGDLEQIDFFIDQELYDDAARVLAKLEAEHGEDPEVVERRLKLKEVGVLLEQVESVDEGAEELFADEEQYIDLAKELEAELAAEEAMVDEATGRGKGEAILEEVFREFQKGVADQLSEEDSDTHFNLGIAYREMGLLPEAIREFQVASRDTAFFVESCSIIGVCYQEQGMWSEAAEWYQKALVAPDISDEARLGLRYDLAAAYEAAGDVEQAVSIFEELASIDSAYRDVSSRLSNLTQQRQAN
jgi:tetratricopeptide (TPR) repeat protein